PRAAHAHRSAAGARAAAAAARVERHEVVDVVVRGVRLRAGGRGGGGPAVGEDEQERREGSHARLREHPTCHKVRRALEESGRYLEVPAAPGAAGAGDPSRDRPPHPLRPGEVRVDLEGVAAMAQVWMRANEAMAVPSGVTLAAMAELDRHTLALTGVSTSNVKTRGALREVRVKVTQGPSRGQQLAVGGRAIVVGADAEADLVLEDPKVSRKHLSLKVVPEGIEVKDLGSTNGVFADGVKVTQAVVAPGASLKVGGSTLKLEAAGARVLQPSERSRFGGLVGESTAMRELFAVLELAAPTDATVLVQGESGTGKELAARALHDHSTR